jgi:hypothetical protein
MDLVACAGSFLLGGLAAVMVMGLLLLFLESPPRTSKDRHYSQQIANTLLRLTDFSKAEKLGRSVSADTMGS